MAKALFKIFTLIELLVVIAIIAILAALLLPSLSSAKATVKKLQCVANLKQQGVAESLYAADYGPYMPMWQATTGGSWGTWGMMWTSREYALQPYIAGAKMPATSGRPTGTLIWLCPASDGIFNKTDSRYYFGSYVTEGNCYEGLYYQYSWSPLSLPPDDKVWKPLTFGAYTRPSGVPTQFCSRRRNFAPQWSCLPDDNNRLGAASFHRKSEAWHRPTLFLDGHAKWLTSYKYTCHGGQTIFTGDQSGWQLSHGSLSKYGNRPYDYWLDEY